MDTDRNLLFAVLALQADLLDKDRFVQACALWATRKHVPIAELLVEQGWLSLSDRADIERLLERKLRAYGGDARASLAAVADDGTPSVRSGTRTPAVDALFAASGPATPSMAPCPNSSGCLLSRFSVA